MSIKSLIPLTYKSKDFYSGLNQKNNLSDSSKRLGSDAYFVSFKGPSGGEDKKLADLKIDYLVNFETSEINAADPAYQKYAQLKNLRPTEASVLSDSLENKWLKHSFVYSNNDDLIEGVILNFLEKVNNKVDKNIKVIQINDAYALLKQLKDIVNAEDTSSSMKKISAILNLKENNAETNVENKITPKQFVSHFIEKLQEKFKFTESDKIVLLFKGVKADKDFSDFSDFLKEFEKSHYDIHLIATGKINLDKTLGQNPLKMFMPDSMHRVIGSIDQFFGKRIDNVQLVKVPDLNAEEWANIISSSENPIGAAANLILKHHNYHFSDDALIKFMSTILVEYDEKPGKDDILAELDLFGNFLTKTKGHDYKTVLENDVNAFLKNDIANRKKMNDLNPLEEIGSMMVPNPFTVVKHSNITFADVIGHEEVKEALTDVLDPYNRHLFEADNSASHSNVTSIMLVGPPGTGKTELAKAAAGEYNGTMIEANAAQLMNQYQSSGSVNASRLKKLIQAASSDLVVVFLDEIDAVGSRNGLGMTSEERKTLNTLLTTIQGAGKQFNKTVLFMFATNKPDVLDDALLSRIERQIVVGAPSHNERIDIFKLHIEKSGMLPDEKINWQTISKLSSGKVGRDIAYIVKSIKKDLIRGLSRETKREIVMNPEKLAKFKLHVTQKDLEKAIDLHNKEHNANSVKMQPGFYRSESDK